MEKPIGHAVKFLRATALKVRAILGYRSEAAFNRRFMAQFGMTPNQLRQVKTLQINSSALLT